MTVAVTKANEEYTEIWQYALRGVPFVPLYIMVARRGSEAGVHVLREGKFLKKALIIDTCHRQSVLFHVIILDLRRKTPILIGQRRNLTEVSKVFTVLFALHSASPLLARDAGCDRMGGHLYLWIYCTALVPVLFSVD